MVQLDVKSPSTAVQSESTTEVQSETVQSETEVNPVWSPETADSTSPVQLSQGEESPPTTYTVEAPSQIGTQAVNPGSA